MTSKHEPPGPMGRGKSRRLLLTLAGAGVVILGLAVLSDGHLPWANARRAHNPSFAGNASRGQSLAEAHCATCHGPDGNSSNTAIPKLAGQTPDYLTAQLQAFRSGARPQPVMAPMAASLTDSDIDDLAKYYSEQLPTPDQSSDADLAARGKRLYYTNGSTMSGCAGCHDPSSGGMAAMMGGSNAPWLSGQHAAYLLAQMNAFASGQRTSSVMDPIAVSLSAEDRRALADYLSSRK